MPKRLRPKIGTSLTTISPNAFRLSDEDKLKLIQFINENPNSPQTLIAEKFKINQSTVSRFIKNREDIFQKVINKPVMSANLLKKSPIKHEHELAANGLLKIDDDDDEDEDEDVDGKWLFQRSFDNQIESEMDLKIENWKKYKELALLEGVKKYYTCGVNLECPARMYHYYEKGGKIIMKRNLHSHECGEEWPQKIPNSIQEPIKEFYSLGIDAAQSIRHELKAIQPQIPNQLQIANFLINNAQCINESSGVSKNSSPSKIVNTASIIRSASIACGRVELSELHEKNSNSQIPPNNVTSHLNRALEPNSSSTKNKKTVAPTEIDPCDNSEKALINVSHRNNLSIEDRVKIIKYFDDHPDVPQTRLAAMFQINQSSVSRILKDRDRLLREYAISELSASRKRLIKHRLSDVDHALWAWYLDAKERGVKIDDTMCIDEANLLANSLDVTYFKADLNWLSRWKFRRLVDKKMNVDDNGEMKVKSGEDVEINDANAIGGEYGGGAYEGNNYFNSFGDETTESEYVVGSDRRLDEKESAYDEEQPGGEDQERQIGFLEVQKSLNTIKTYMKQNNITDFESYQQLENAISMNFASKQIKQESVEFF